METLKKIKINAPVIICIEIILLVIAFFAYKYIYEVEMCKNSYAESSEKFVEENKQPVFRIGKVIIYSSAKAVDNSDGELKNIDISQFTDMEIYIDNTGKSDKITAENTVNELYIDNIKVSTQSEKGEKKFNYKSPYSFGKYEDISNFQKDGILFKVLTTNNENTAADYENQVFYTDCSNPLSLSYVNKNILTGCEVNTTNGSISFDGTILKSANVNISEIEPEFEFSIHITNNYNETFVCNLKIDDVLTSANDGIESGYLMKVLNTEDEKYNFLKISD